MASMDSTPAKSVLVTTNVVLVDWTIEQWKHDAFKTLIHAAYVVEGLSPEQIFSWYRTARYGDTPRSGAI
eukprot:5486996-Prymnesium_polylepis.1